MRVTEGSCVRYHIYGPMCDGAYQCVCVHVRLCTQTQMEEQEEERRRDDVSNVNSLIPLSCL